MIFHPLEGLLSRIIAVLVNAVVGVVSEELAMKGRLVDSTSRPVIVFSMHIFQRQCLAT